MTDFTAGNDLTSIVIPNFANLVPDFCCYAIRADKGFVVEAHINFTEQECCSSFHVNKNEIRFYVKAHTNQACHCLQIYDGLDYLTYLDETHNMKTVTTLSQVLTLTFFSGSGNRSSPQLSIEYKQSS